MRNYKNRGDDTSDLVNLHACSRVFQLINLRDQPIFDQRTSKKDNTIERNDYTQNYPDKLQTTALATVV